MSFRIANIHEYNRFIAIDLGAYRVRASLYSIDDGHLCHEHSATVRQNRKNFLDGSITDMQGVALTIKKAIHQACAHVDEVPDDIILAFSPAVCIHDVTTNQYIRSDREAPLSMQEIDTMIEKIEQASLSRAKEKARTEYGLIHDDIRLISSTLTSILIDGKRVTNPIGFSGSQVRMTVLNVFTLSSEYNILRSIVSSLEKRTIALVPMPLIFPKVLERGEHAGEDTIYLDIGYMHTTIVFEKKGEIHSFDTFPFGSKMLLDMFSLEFPKLSYVEIENLMTREKPKADEKDIRDRIFREYFDYIIDTLLSLVSRERGGLDISHVLVSGGIFGTPWIQALFFEVLCASTRYDGRHLQLAETRHEDSLETREYLITEGLALLALELLFTKKDPLIRILRYALYHYE